MDIFDQMLEFISATLTSLIGNVLLFGILGGIAGLIVGIFLIRKLRANRVFHRPGKLWSFLSKTAYVFLPVSFFLMGLSQGAIWGAHTTTVEFVDNTTTPIIDYAENYIPELQAFVNGYVLPEGSTAEQIVSAHNDHMAQRKTGFIMRSFNALMLGAALELSPLSADFADPVQRLQKINLKQLDRGLFEVIPSFMKAYAAFWFAPIYWACFIPFGVYFLSLIVEIILFRKVYQRLFDTPDTLETVHLRAA